MGLDIYLYRYENLQKTEKLENKYEKISEKNWNDAGEYDKLTDKQKEDVRALNEKEAIALGLDKSGTDKENKQKIEIDSAIDPKHYFKIGYFRSSYNDGGINTILRNLGVPDLYDIFEPEDRYCFQPDWDSALEKCNESIEALEKKGNYRCFDVSQNLFKSTDELCKSEQEALQIFEKELSRETCSFGAYSNNKGEFFVKEPLKVLALISGTNNILRKDTPCTYVICEGENQWYVNALKIVKETIEYVLSQKDKQKYYLHWSG